MVKDSAIGAEGVGFDPGQLRSDIMWPTARHRCDVSS